MPKASLTVKLQKQNKKKHRFDKAWMHEHLNDYHVREAKRLGYRSRAAFKLLEIDREYELIKSGSRVVDLGCSPGGWCQVIAQKLASKDSVVQPNGKGCAIGVDLLAMEPIGNLQFLQGDFTEVETLQKLVDLLKQTPLDLVLSDMSPNISGIVLSDQAKSYQLAELALEFALNWLRPGGHFLIKVFQGGEIDLFRLNLRRHFQMVYTLKPEASRGRSRELYLLAKYRK